MERLKLRKNIDAINGRTSMTKATEQHRQKKRVNKMKLLLHLAEQFVKRVSIAVPAKSDLPRVFLPTNPKHKKTKG